MADNENVEFSGPTPPCSSTTANTSKRAASWQTELRRYLAERVGQPVPAFEIYKRILVPPWVSWRFWCRRHRGVNFEPTLVTVTWERISAVLLEYPLEYDPPRRRRRTLQGNSLITPLQRP